MTKVMVVDDVAFMAKVARVNLEKKGYEVVVAENGQRCLDTVQQENPDVILLDVEMPVMEGWECCEALKSNEATKDIPVIMCTGDDSEDYMQKATTYGAAEYIVKPYQPDIMAEKIEKVLKK